MPLSVLPLEVPRGQQSTAAAAGTRRAWTRPEQHQRESGFVHRKGDSRSSFQLGPKKPASAFLCQLVTSELRPARWPGSMSAPPLLCS